MCLYSQLTKRKCALTSNDLELVSIVLTSSTLHDDKLFLTQLLTGFHALLHLGELVWPNNPKLHSSCKLVCCTSVQRSPGSFSFLLHSHKSDKFFNGDQVLVDQQISGVAPVNAFSTYLTSCDSHFPFHPQLWLCANGSVPTHCWFTTHLHQFFPSDVSGHFMHSGGATALAIAGIPSSSIQAIGQWSSDAWQLYICKYPMIVHMLMVTNQLSHIHAASPSA